MANLSIYTDLNPAICDWEERTYTTAQTDEFILIAEAKANRLLARDWNRQATSTVATDSTGYGTLPTGFLGLVSIKRDLVGSVPLTQVAWDAIDRLNPDAIADDANVYAISGTQFRVEPVVEDDFLLTFDKKISALTSTNTTNWLLSLAPDYYLFACQSAAAAKNKAYGEAGALQAQADGILSELVSQANVAQWGNVEMTLPMVTP
jgi:hypothetical protein